MIVSYIFFPTLLFTVFQLAANVRLEQATYLTSEDGPLSIQVCAVMISPVVTDCPVDRRVRVTVRSNDETAGKCITLLLSRG